MIPRCRRDDVGQSAISYAKAFPDSKIHSFEPVPETFAQLSEALRPYPNVVAHNIALSNHSGTVVMTAIGTLTGNKIVDAATAGSKPGAAPNTVVVPSETGASFVARHGITRVSFLKIDAEGHDFDVLLGFVPVLGQVDFVQVEASMNVYNKVHVPFRVLEDLLRHQGFLLFRFYDQAFEAGRGGRPVMRRVNPVFINASLVDMPKAR
jgi:FkbM family methyltransferase